MHELRVFYGHHKCASRYFRMSLLAPMARAAGWEVIAYSINNPKFHFRRLDELDLQNIDYCALKASRPQLLILSNSSSRVRNRITQAVDRPILGLRVLRDPRQILVSNYYHHLNGHDLETEHWVWDRLKEDRTILSRLSLSEGLNYEMNGITRELLETQLFAWSSDETILEVRLEDFTKNPAKYGRKIAKHLQLPVDSLPMPNNSFSNPNAKPWQNSFDSQLKSEFKARYGSKLIDMGYETSFDW